MISLKQLNSAYRKETNAIVKERILLVKHVRYDKKEASSVAEIELNKTRTWAYKWLHRFDRDGLEGLKDKERSGSRPSSVSKEIMVKIRKELEDSIILDGISDRLWISLKRGQASNTTKYISIHCCINGALQ